MTIYSSFFKIDNLFIIFKGYFAKAKEEKPDCNHKYYYFISCYNNNNLLSKKLKWMKWKNYKE